MPRANKLQKVTIVPRGRAGGYALFLPDEDNLGLQSFSYFKAEMVVAMGGRAAEEIIFGPEEITTGASADLVSVTRTARSMVTRYGMSDKLGPIVFGEKEELIFLGREISEQRNYGDEVARQIDMEVHRFASEAYETAYQILSSNRTLLDDMANALLEFETLEGDRLAELLSRVTPLTIDMTRQSGNGQHVAEPARSLPPPAVA